MNTKTFAVVTTFLTVTIIVALFAFVYVATFAITGESILPFRRDNTVAPTLGEWVGNTYTNEYLGLVFEMPPGWERGEDHAISGQVGFPEDATELDSWFVSQPIIVMMAFDPNAGTDTQRPYVEIAFERLPRSPRINTAEYVRLTAEPLEAAGIRVNTELPSVEIGNYEWHQLGVEIDVYIEDWTYQRHRRLFINVERGFARIIGILYETPDVVDEILAMFSTLADSTYEAE